MKVTVVTVTYGERFAYLKKVLLSALEQGVDEIIVVSNAGSQKTLHGLSALKTENLPIQVIANKKNLGSAQGFQQGIAAAQQTKNDFIWLLDDDNMLLNGALSPLKKTWENLVPKENLSQTALLSYRADRKIYKKAVEQGNPYGMLGPKNSFLGFSLAQKIKAVFGKKKLTNPKGSVKIGQVAVAPYGGLFFHTSLIEEIGYPDPRYFLYADDHDFTYRITKKGGAIYLVLDSELKDLEKSFHLKKRNGATSNRFLKTESKNKIFYSVRNGITFEQNFVENRLVYFLNGTVYTILIFGALLVNYPHFWKFNHYLKGVVHSMKKQ